MSENKDKYPHENASGNSIRSQPVSHTGDYVLAYQKMRARNIVLKQIIQELKSQDASVMRLLKRINKAEIFTQSASSDNMDLIINNLKKRQYEQSE